MGGIETPGFLEPIRYGLFMKQENFTIAEAQRSIEGVCFSGNVARVVLISKKVDLYYRYLSCSSTNHVFHIDRPHYSLR